MPPLFILGTGGQARDLAEVAHVAGYRPVFVTRDPTLIAKWNAADEIVLESDAIRRTTESFAIGIGDNRTRSILAEKLRHLVFPSVIHPETSFGRGQREVAEAAAGTVIFAGVRISVDVSIGHFCSINLNVTLSHDVELGDFVGVSPGANIAGNVRVGTGSLIGIGAAINQGDDERKREIGPWTVIGSGAVVTNDCDSDSVYVGIPARKVL